MATPNDANESKQVPSSMSGPDPGLAEELKNETIFMETTLEKQNDISVEEQLAYAIANGIDIDWFLTNMAKEEEERNKEFKQTVASSSEGKNVSQLLPRKVESKPSEDNGQQIHDRSM